VCDEVSVPEPNFPEYNYPEYKLDVPTLPTDLTGSTEASGDDNGVEVLQAGASALGGAGLALGGLWLYRRRRAPAV
jgi:LPXTG-motif cell wall-anchored protein